MRDQIVGDQLHFEQRISNLDEYRALTEGRVADGQFVDLGSLPGHVGRQLDRVISMYSMGADISEVREAYAELPEWFSRDLWYSPTAEFDPATLGSVFNSFLWVTSLAVLFDDVEGAQLLAGAVMRKGVNDFLIDSFLGSLVDFREPSQALQLEAISEFHGLTPTIRSHEKLKKAAELAAVDPIEASSALTKYVAKEWYGEHKWAAWHNQHSSRRGSDNYSGYWCFEGAATAKVFGIDDSELETCKYYPWDLAHP